jgi:hypothetical protein
MAPEGYQIPAILKSATTAVTADGAQIPIKDSSVLREIAGNQLDGVEDNTQLQDLHDGSLLFNIQIRYKKEAMYTYTGNILVAVNPYQVYPIYDLDHVRKYRKALLGDLPPHIFAIANAAYTQMRNKHRNQVVIISGESGAGKTESTKLINKYLAAVNTEQSMVAEQVLESSPIMESFGNAKTVRNNNSSRFGKYMEMQFGEGGQIIGAETNEYLLEKSRVVFQASGERNYHIFYEMLIGLSAEERQLWRLQSWDKYKYLEQGGSEKAGHKDDAEDYFLCSRALEVMGFKIKEIETIFRLLAGILHLGNVAYAESEQDGMEAATITNVDLVNFVAGLFNLPPQVLRTSLECKTTITAGENFVKPLSVGQAVDKRDALAKTIYARLFSWLVLRINEITCRPACKNTIGVLDIFGFEDFQNNSFEQLCINFANERLQFYFNQHIFKLEQEEYSKEGIGWENIAFVDNQGCLDLIIKRPIGIFVMLDDECNFPKGSDESFLNKIHNQHATNDYYEKPKVNTPSFGVYHYAGKVEYEVSGFLERNKDMLHEDLIRVILASPDEFLKNLFAPLQAQLEVAAGAKKKKVPSLASQFAEQLGDLVSTMQQCNPFFVRCIKPNTVKKPGVFDNSLVLEQLRYSGMLETIRIRRMGFPVRLSFEDFEFRYRSLFGSLRGPDPKSSCQALMGSLAAEHHGMFQIGVSKVFMREGVERHLESMRGQRLRGSVLTMQRWVRGYLARIKYRRLRYTILHLQKLARGQIERMRYRKAIRGIARMQAWGRMLPVRRKYIKMRDEARKKKVAKPKKDKVEETKRKGGEPIAAGVNLPPMVLAALQALGLFKPPYPIEKSTSKHKGEVPRTKYPIAPTPADLDSYAFSKYAATFFAASAEWSYSKDSIERPFTKVDAQYAEAARSLFDTILKYTSDTKMAVGSKEDMVLPLYLALEGLSQPALRDEIYVQLINQTHECPSSAVEQRVWHLLAVVSTVFPPSQKLYPYVLRRIAKAGPSGAVSDFARYALQRCVANKARERPPSMLEWHALRDYSPMVITVEYQDGKTTTLPIDSSTTSRELARAALEDRYKERASDIGGGWTVAFVLDGKEAEFDLDEHVMDRVSSHERWSSIFDKMSLPTIKDLSSSRDESLTSSPTVRRAGTFSRMDPSANAARAAAATAAASALRPERIPPRPKGSAPPPPLPPKTKPASTGLVPDAPPALEAAEDDGPPALEDFGDEETVQKVQAVRRRSSLAAERDAALENQLDDMFNDVLGDYNGDDNENMMELVSRIKGGASQLGSGGTILGEAQLRRLTELMGRLRGGGSAFDNNASIVSLSQTSGVAERVPPPKGTPIMYTNVPWKLRLRKVGLSPGERLSRDPAFDLVYAQIVRDTGDGHSTRMQSKERNEVRSWLDAAKCKAADMSEALRDDLIALVKSLPIYFCRMFEAEQISGKKRMAGARNFVGISHEGLQLLEQDQDGKLKKPLLKVMLSEVSSVSSEHGQVRFNLGSEPYVFGVRRPKALEKFIEAYAASSETDAKFVYAAMDYMVADETLLSFKQGDVIQLSKREGQEEGWLFGVLRDSSGWFPAERIVAIMGDKPDKAAIEDAKKRAIVRRSSVISSTENLPPGVSANDAATPQGVQSSEGRYSMMEWARQYYRHGAEQMKMLRSNKGSIRGTLKFLTGKKKKKGPVTEEEAAVAEEQWTWNELSRLVKYQKQPIPASLNALPPEDAATNKLALEGFVTIMRYMGDYPAKNRTDIELVQWLLRCAMQNDFLRDEIYCQIIKQLTANKSKKEAGEQRGWQIMLLLTAFVKPTDEFEPYLRGFIRSYTSDSQKNFSNVASLCDRYLSKTIRCGGRKIMPSAPELEALKLNRNTKIQRIFLPGDHTKSIKVNAVTVVLDVVKDICTKMGVANFDEYGVFINTGPEQSTPLQSYDYMLDTTTILERRKIPYRIYVKKTLWFAPITLENPLHTSLLYEQVLFDYLCGNLLNMSMGTVPATWLKNDIALLAALQHQASPSASQSLQDAPVSLLQKYVPTILYRLLQPDEWRACTVAQHPNVAKLQSVEARRAFMEIIIKLFPLYGSCFFHVNSCSDPRVQGDCVMAVSKNGVSFLESTTKNVIMSYTFNEIVSTRRLGSRASGKHFVDLKVGNLMVQKVTRCESQQGLEITTLISAYIQKHLVEQQQRELVESKLAASASQDDLSGY